MSDVLNSHAGSKDHHKELFAVWNAIFQISMSLKGEDKFSTEKDLDLRVKNLITVINMNNEYEKLMQGVFENFLHQKISGLDKITEALLWFTFNDQLLTAINRHQCYATYKYVSYAFVSWHLSFASTSWPKINFPNRTYEVSQKLNEKNHVLDTIKRRKNVNCLRGTNSFTNSIFFIKHIITIHVRPVSIELLSTNERFIFEKTVNIMVDMGLVFVQLRLADGSNEFHFDPNIDLLFQLVDNSVPPISNWCKQMLSREIDVTLIQQNRVKFINAKRVENKKKDGSRNKHIIEDKIPNFLVKLQYQINSPSKTDTGFSKKDFFGRIENLSTVKLNHQNSKIVSVIKGSVWYFYKEGFNNAVRKNLTLGDFV